MLKRLAWISMAAALIGACGPTDDLDAEGTDSIEQAVRVAVPARIQAEAYDRFNELTPASNQGGQCNRNDGVDMELTSDPNGGTCNVGWTDAGEWLEYDISVTTAQSFNIIARVASAQTLRALHIELDGQNLGQLQAPSAGWQSWQDRTWSNINIGAGNHTLRVVFDNGSINLNYIELTQNGASCTDGIKNGNETGVDCGGSCPACPSTCVEQLLPGSNTTASSQETAQTPASNATDGNASTRWSSLFADPQWVMTDLGASRKVSRVVLNWEAAYSRDYDVQVADSTNGPWTNLFTTSTGTGGIVNLTGLNGKGRYVRMFSRARGTQWGNSLWEMTTYGDPNPNCSNPTGPTCTDGIKNGTETGIDCGGSCPACPPAPTCTDGIKNGTETGIDCGGSCPACQATCVQQALARVAATASSTENATFPAGNAIDASLTTRWSSAFSDPQWIVVDLGANRRVSRVVLNWEAAASANYDVQISTSSSGPWTNMFTTAAGNGGVDDLTNLSGVGRYVRMFSRARTTPYGNSLFDFAIYGDNNPNCTPSNTGVDTDGDRLPDSVETNTGVFVNSTNTGTNPNNPDSDGDGLPDGDEVLGTTGGLNLPAMGTNPLRKNILLEYDWFTDPIDCFTGGPHNHRPAANQIDRLNLAFASAPVTNPDGSTGITVINDYGQGGLFTGGNLINDADGIVDGLGPEYDAYKAANFAANRQGYFHYVILPHHYTSTSNFSSGVAFFNDYRLIVSLQCIPGTDNAFANTIMHELGHNLGLNHGGPLTLANSEFNNKPNYASVMNYDYQFPGIDVDCQRGGDGVLDYSRKRHIDLNENTLNESLGMCDGVDVDWDFDGVIESSVVYDLNFDSQFGPMLDLDDWSNLFYDFAPSGAGAAPMTVAPQIAVCDNPAPTP